MVQNLKSFWTLWRKSALAWGKPNSFLLFVRPDNERPKWATVLLHEKRASPLEVSPCSFFAIASRFFRRSVDQDRRRPCFGAKVARGDRVSKTSCCSSWFEMGFFRPRRNASDALFIDEPHVHACIFRPSRRPNTSQQCQWENGESTGYFEQNCLTHGLFSEGRRGGECFCLLPCLHFCWKTERNHFHCNILYCNIIFLKCSFEMWV